MTKRPSSYRPTIESLEQREVPAAGAQAYITGGNLYVLGSTGNDTITVNEFNNQVSVAGTQIAVGTSKLNSVNASTFGNVMVYSNGGNDVLDLSTVQNNATVYAGSGNDTIYCGGGNDNVVNGGGFDWIYRPENLTAPMGSGQSVSNIQQGQSPMCQTLAALAEAVQQNHNFAKDITYLGNDYYQVKLYGNLKTQTVYFNGWTTSNDPVVSSQAAFWTVLMQRARLQALGINPNVEYTQSQWDAMNQRTGGQLYSIGDALYGFTGSVSTYSTLNSYLSPATVQADLAAGNYVIAQSNPANNYVSSDGIIGNHAYAVLSVYQLNGVWLVRLYNPWGVDSVNGKTIDAANPSQPASNDGYITLTWAQFIKSTNFSNIYIAKPGQ